MDGSGPFQFKTLCFGVPTDLGSSPSSLTSRLCNLGLVPCPLCTPCTYLYVEDGDDTRVDLRVERGDPCVSGLSIVPGAQQARGRCCFYCCPGQWGWQAPRWCLRSLAHVQLPASASGVTRHRSTHQPASLALSEHLLCARHRGRREGTRSCSSPGGRQLPVLTGK